MNGLNADDVGQRGECEIRLARDPNNSSAAETTRRILCNRRVLIRVPYFVALFARTQPDTTARSGSEPPIAAYNVAVPSGDDAAAFVLARLHEKADTQSTTVYHGDPLDIVEASLFFGLSDEWVCHLVVQVLRNTVECASCIHPSGYLQAKAHTNDVGRIDHNLDIARLVAGLLDSDIHATLKSSLASRFAYLFRLPQPDFNCRRCYTPEAGRSATRADGDAVWHGVRLAFDAMGHGAHRATCMGISFDVSLTFETSGDDDSDSHDNDSALGSNDADSVVLRVHSAPVGERLGRWASNEPFPAGAVHAPACAMRARVRLYHPTRGLVVDDAPITAWNSAPTSSRHLQGTTALRRWGVPVPHGFDRTFHGSARRATRAARTSTIAMGVDPRDRALWACEVAFFVRRSKRQQKAVAC